jgi:hypothetical protein
VDAPRTFFADPHAHPAVGVPSLVAAALAAVAVARFSGGWPHRADEGAGLRFLDPLLADLTTLSRGVRALLVAGALALATYAGALTVLETGQWLGDDLVASFEWSHVAISVLLAAGGLAATLVPLHRWRTFVTAAAAGALGTAALKVGAFDLERLADPPRGIAALSVGLALAVAALALVRRSTLHGDALGLVALAVALPLEVAGSIVLTERASWNGLDAPALALLGLTLVHACLAAVSFMRPYGRNHSTAQGFVALVLGGVAIHGLLDGLPRTLVLAAVGTGLAALAVAVRERRLLPAALAYEIVAACYAITLEGPPAHLFAVHEHPGAGLPALLAALGGALALLVAERGTADAERRLPERVERAASDLVPAWLWGLGVGAVYAASLAILELAEILLTGSVEADFQRGHTAVSAFWALVGVVLLHAGLVRGRRVLRTAGFTALGITLVKIFAYDLAALPAATRSVSFLAVGALLLVAGFFYQRLAAAAAERHGNRRGDGVPEPSGL